MYPPFNLGVNIYGGTEMERCGAMAKGTSAERDVRLSAAQRVAFYELVASSLKAADRAHAGRPHGDDAQAAIRRARRHRRDSPRAHALLRGARPGAEGAVRGDELGVGSRPYWPRVNVAISQHCSNIHRQSTSSISFAII